MDKKVIDFTNKDQLSEVFFIGMFGSIVQSILKAMFGNISIPVTIKGSPGQIQSFANVLGKEKSYIQAIKNHGLDSPVTFRDKYKLEKAAKEFERETGVTWPFK